MLAKGQAPLPTSGTELTVNGRTIGALGSVAGTDGLAIVRIDRVKDAVDSGTVIEASGVTVTLSIPAWAGYTLPESVTGDQD